MGVSPPTGRRRPSRTPASRRVEPRDQRFPRTIGFRGLAVPGGVLGPLATYSPRSSGSVAYEERPAGAGAFRPAVGEVGGEMYDSGDLTVQQIAEEFGVTRPTIYRHLGKSVTATR
jgi:hypothetical protein